MGLRNNYRKLTTAWTTTVTAVLKRSREQVHRHRLRAAIGTLGLLLPG